MNEVQALELKRKQLEKELEDLDLEIKRVEEEAEEKEEKITVEYVNGNFILGFADKDSKDRIMIHLTEQEGKDLITMIEKARAPKSFIKISWDDSVDNFLEDSFPNYNEIVSRYFKL